MQANIEIPIIFDAKVEARLAQSLANIQAAGFISFQHKFYWQLAQNEKMPNKQRGIMVDFADEYEAWLKFVVEKQKRELTTNEKLRIFCDFLRMKLELDPLPRGASNTNKRNE